METQKPLLKDKDGEEVDVHMYRSMISSLMYLTSSIPDIMFVVCACARYQVNPKISHLYDVKRIFRYLKGQPKLSLWYPKDSPFDLVAYTDSGYAGASLDMKSTTGGILIEPVKPMKKKDQIRRDEETALKLQAEFDEEERLAREKAKKEKEANIALIETWDDIQAKIDADHQLAERLQAQEQEELSVEEKATLFQQLLEKRRKHFAAKRAEEKRNKPPTKAQQRKIMCTYLKNMEGYKLQDLKLKGFDSIQEMFDRAFKRVNTFEDFRTELVEGKEKRAGTELIQENAKKQKVEDDKETAELKQCLEIIPDEEEVTIDAIPLAVKSPSIVGWKIHKEGRKSYYQIMRADGKSQMYMIFSHMLKSFNREDLEDLYKLVKAKYKSTRPVEDLDLLLWGDLKTMFEPHVEDKIWRNQQDYKVLDWKLYDSCGVHSLRMQHMQIYMLVEKKYPLAPLTLSMMLEKKLIIDYESEMAYQLLKFIIKQLKKLQAQDQEELTDTKKARLFVQFLEKRRKHFAAKRAEREEEQTTNKSSTKEYHVTELVEESSKMEEIEFLVESSKKVEAEIAQKSSSKRAGEELEQESSKKQKVEEDKESKDLKKCLEIVLDDGDDVTIDATPLSIKSPTIVDYKIYQEGKKSFF
ncbi:hypothetical protein Tco_1502210 [Tanacetum coccineum]